MHSIPIIDAKALHTNNSEDRNKLAQAVRSACESDGFFYLTNHGLPDDLIAAAFDQSRQFFAKPLSEKIALDITKSPSMRGYFALEAEKPEYESKGDLKEGFDMSLDLPEGSALSDSSLYGPNVWPLDMPQFKDVMTNYHACALNLGRQLLSIFALGLGMQEDFFNDKFSVPLAQLRLLHYPPQLGEVTKTQMGAGEHTDFGCLTLLLQDEIGGLEVQHRNGDWIAVPPLKSALIVNIGDLMTRWTNGHYQATVHRVINRANAERYSLVFFLDPNYEAEVACISTCANEGNNNFPPIIVGNYMNERFDATFSFRTQAANTASIKLPA